MGTDRFYHRDIIGLLKSERENPRLGPSQLAEVLHFPLRKSRDTHDRDGSNLVEPVVGIDKLCPGWKLEEDAIQFLDAEFKEGHRGAICPFSKLPIRQPCFPCHEGFLMGKDVTASIQHLSQRDCEPPSFFVVAFDAFFWERDGSVEHHSLLGQKKGMMPGKRQMDQGKSGLLIPKFFLNGIEYE